MIIPDVFKMLESRSSADSAAGDKARSMPRSREAGRNEPPPAAATILEVKGIKVTLFPEEKIEEDFYKGIAVNCKSWMCESCRIPKGLNLRKQLLSKVNLFKVPRLYTVTVNRNYFTSPQAAYDYVMHGKFLARLLTKEMGVVRWFWVLEVQEASGEGWPHWHILIDVADLPGRWYNRETRQTRVTAPKDKSGWCYIPHFFDLNKVHHLLHKWKIGEQCKLSIRRDEFQSPEHAVRYITKYLIKPPVRGFPQWMLEKKGLRFYQPSKAVGSMSAVKKTVSRKDKEPDGKLRHSRLPVDRIAACGKQVLFTCYNPEKDKNFVTRPIMATKESIALVAGAVCVQDFDFRTSRSFPVLGFNSIEGIQNFIDIWKNPQLQAELQAQIEEKRQELLLHWSMAS